jgi:uncharacterized protein
VISVDSGFLFALADASDRWHKAALAQAGTVDEGWITTSPVLAEACHLLHKRIGAVFVPPLMDDIAAGVIQVWNPPVAACQAIPELMRKYARLPMDLADASLVLLAEHLGHGRILSTDERDFGAYRWKRQKPFNNLLEPLK